MLGLDVDGRHDEGRMWAVLRFFCPPPLQPVGGGGGGKENQPSPAQPSPGSEGRGTRQMQIQRTTVGDSGGRAPSRACLEPSPVGWAGATGREGQRTGRHLQQTAD